MRLTLAEYLLNVSQGDILLLADTLALLGTLPISVIEEADLLFAIAAVGALEDALANGGRVIEVMRVFHFMGEYGLDVGILPEEIVRLLGGVLVVDGLLNLLLQFEELLQQLQLVAVSGGYAIRAVGVEGIELGDEQGQHLQVWVW